MMISLLSDVLGQYDFASHYLINCDMNSESGAQTILHEAYHMIFTLQSSYGYFLHMHTRISVIDNRFSYINEILLKHSVKVQECACTFFEILFIIKTKSYESAMTFIKDLRANNREYYNYVKPLLPLLDFLKIEKDVPSNEHIKLPIDLINELVIGLVLISLNVDLTKINSEIYRSQKKLKVFLSSNGASEEFIPNRIFKNLVHALISDLQENKSIDNILHQIEDKLPQKDRSTMSLMKDKNIQLIQNIYGDSKSKEVIIDSLSMSAVKEVDSIDILGSGIPTSSNKIYPGELVDEIEIIKFSQNVVGALLVFGTVQTLLAKPTRQYFIQPDLDSIREINEQYIATFLDLENHKHHLTLCNQTSLNEICTKAKCPIIINYKAYDLVKSIIKSDIPFYIYCDRSYNNAVGIIEKYVNKKAALISFNQGGVADLLVLVIELNTDEYFFLPMVDIAKINLFRDIKSGKLQIDLSLEIDEELLLEFEIIINCIFYY